MAAPTRTRSVRAIYACCLIALVMPTVTACGSKNGGGVGCTDIGCESMIHADIPVAIAGGGVGTVEARVCLDGTCRFARGALNPRQTKSGALRGDSFFQSGIEVRVYEDLLEVLMRLPNDPYDDVTSHEFVVELQVGDNDPVILERNMKFKRNEPNGPNCSPTCWFANLRASV